MSVDPLDIARQWVDAMLPSLETVIFEKQIDITAPRPDLPYATVDIPDFMPLGQSAVQVTDTPYVGMEETRVTKTHCNHYQGTLRVKLFGEDIKWSAYSLANSLNRSDGRAILRGEDPVNNPENIVVIANLLSLMDTTGIRSTVREQSYELDYQIRWIHNISLPVNWIETIVLNRDIQDPSDTEEE